jgi:hypothetical protein
MCAALPGAAAALPLAASGTRRPAQLNMKRVSCQLQMISTHSPHSHRRTVPITRAACDRRQATHRFVAEIVLDWLGVLAGCEDAEQRHEGHQQGALAVWRNPPASSRRAQEQPCVLLWAHCSEADCGGGVNNKAYPVRWPSSSSGVTKNSAPASGLP